MAGPGQLVLQLGEVGAGAVQTGAAGAFATDGLPGTFRRHLDGTGPVAEILNGVITADDRREPAGATAVGTNAALDAAGAFAPWTIAQG